MAAVRTVSDRARDYRPSRKCMMNDSSRDGRLYCVVQRSLEEKPEVYRYRCCVGRYMLLLDTSCKSLFQVSVNGQKEIRHRQPTCRRGTDQT